MQETRHGQVVLVDPPEADRDERAPTHPETEKWFDLFGVQGCIRYLRMPLDDALPVARDLAGGRNVRLVVIDRADERDRNLRAFDGYLSMIDRGVVLRRREHGWIMLPFDAHEAPDAETIAWDQGLILADRSASLSTDPDSVAWKRR